MHCLYLPGLRITVGSFRTSLSQPYPFADFDSHFEGDIFTDVINGDGSNFCELLEIQSNKTKLGESTPHTMDELLLVPAYT